MATITFLSKQRLKNATHLGVMSDFSVQLQAIDHAKFAEAKAKFMAALGKEDADFKRATTSSYTNQIAEADANRDAAYMRIKRVVTAFEGNGTNDQAQAANKIAPILRNYAVEVTAQYDEETARISQLCQELDTMSSDLSKLSLTGAYSELKTNNELLRTLITSRNTEQSAYSGIDLKADRAATDTAYDEAVAMLNAIILYDADSKCLSLAAVWNENLNRIRRQITHSGTISMANDVVSDPTPDDDPDFNPEDGI